MKLGDFDLEKSTRPYFIAEMSGNHNQSLEKALEIVDAAAASGADALKIQTYTPDTMTLDLKHGEFFIEDSKSLWKGRSLYDLYKEAMTPWEWHEDIQKRCHQKGIEFFSTPFDASAVDFLEGLNVPYYKIASFENIDLPLIAKVANTGKPIIISTGMATIEEIQEAVTCARANGSKDIVLLKCTSSYPAPCSDANLMTILDLKTRFNVISGLSDHTLGEAVPITSVALGAKVIEKHFTISRGAGGVDSAFSLEPSEFSRMVNYCTQASEAIGKIFYGVAEAEKKSLIFRRSIYISKDVEEGETINLNNVKVIRPGLGLKPKYLNDVIGKKFTRSLPKGTALSFDLIK